MTLQDMTQNTEARAEVLQQLIYRVDVYTDLADSNQFRHDRNIATLLFPGYLSKHCQS